MSFRGELLEARSDRLARMSVPSFGYLEAEIAELRAAAMREIAQLKADALREIARAKAVALAEIEETKSAVAVQIIRAPTVFQQIKKLVCESYGISEVELRSARRHQALAMPRHIVCYLARIHTLLSLPQIGRGIGNRDHTTVLHATRHITELRKTDAALAAELTALERRLTEEEEGQP